MNWPGRVITSKLGIRAVAVIMFRKWFGRNPDYVVWEIKGCEGEARDRRGNCVQIDQWNGYDGWPQDLTRLALPAPGNEVAK